MSIGCENHTAMIYDRGGTAPMGVLDGIVSLQWERLRDDISSARIDIADASGQCMELLKKTRALRHELVIFRERGGR